MKKKLFFLVFFILIVLLFSFLYITKPPILNCPHFKGNVNGVLKKVPPLKIVYLYGNGYERGFQHGKLLKKDIKYVVSVLKRVVGPFAYYVAILEAKKLDVNIPKEYRCEMEGVAEGAGVSYYDILLINTFDDLKHLVGCSSLIVVKSNFSKEFIFARNLDYPHSELARKNIIFVYKNMEKHSYISVAFPGYIGVLTGFNDAGICISIHTSATRENQWGIPTGFLLRECMENSNSLNDLFKIVSTSKRCQGNNLMVGSFKENLAAVIEYTAKHMGIRYFPKDRGFIECTNHFQIEKMKQYNKSRWKNSLKRASFMENSLRKGNITFDSVRSIFTYYDGNKIEWTSVANKGTVQSVIFLPDRDLMLVGKGISPPVNKDGFLRFKMSEFIQIK